LSSLHAQKEKLTRKKAGIQGEGGHRKPEGREKNGKKRKNGGKENPLGLQIGKREKASSWGKKLLPSP